MDHRAAVLITPAELHTRLGAGSAAPVLLDVRWQLGEPRGAGATRYAVGHLPGAHFLDLETVLTRHTGDPRDGRHPLPEPATVAAALEALGVTRASEVVVYDEAGSYAAARAWWVLRWLGVRVRVLDGGIAAWVRAGLALTDTPPAQASHAPGPLVLDTRHLPTVDAEGAARAPVEGLLVDVRAPERFRGELEPLDPIPGHIPGAVNVPVSGLFAADGSLPDAAALGEVLAPALLAAAAGAPVVVYCGSGVSAAQAVLALASLDVEAALYPGSWSQWSNTPGRPVATGS